MSSSRRFESAIAGLIVCLASIAVADEAELPPGATVLDPDVMMYSWPYPVISPDGQWVAYISKGFVCVCNVMEPSPRRLFEAPNTWTHFLAQPEQAHAKGVFHKSFGPGREEYRAAIAKITNTIYGLRWTDNVDGVVFGVSAGDAERKKWSHDIWHVSINGAVTNLAHTNQDTPTVGIVDALLTRDRRYLVSQGSSKPLIWDVSTNKPRATCFLNLTPSPTSGRWIGIEKDTWQLVIADANFDIERRFNEFQPAKHGKLELKWSPDERFILWRNQIGFDHFSNWIGFWMELETGEKRELSGRYMDEQFAFTGRGGEFVRWGATGEKTRGYDRSIGAHLTLVPGADQSAVDMWRIEQNIGHTSGFPPVRIDANYTLFAVGMPRPPGEEYGFVWHLLDREGNTWRFPGEDNNEFISPFEVIGFADAGKVIVGHDGKRIFSFPVAKITEATE